VVGVALVCFLVAGTDGQSVSLSVANATTAVPDSTVPNATNATGTTAVPATTATPVATTATTTAVPLPPPSTVVNTTTAAPPPASTTGAPNTTNTTAAPSSAPSGVDGGSPLLWYHIVPVVLVIGALIIGACYTAIVWQQSAVLKYKATFEEMVGRMAKRRRELDDANDGREWKAQDDGAGDDGNDAAELLLHTDAITGPGGTGRAGAAGAHMGLMFMSTVGSHNTAGGSAATSRLAGDLREQRRVEDRRAQRRAERDQTRHLDVMQPSLVEARPVSGNLARLDAQQRRTLNVSDL
jgi:hypothetical protein